MDPLFPVEESFCSILYSDLQESIGLGLCDKTWFFKLILQTAAALVRVFSVI